MENIKVRELLIDLGYFVQEMEMLAMSGKTADWNNIRRSVQKLNARCEENSLSVCVFRKIIYPAKDNPPVSFKEAKLHNWPAEKGSVHAHITCVFRITHIGHPEMIAEEIEIELTAGEYPENSTHDQPEQSKPKIAGDEGRLLSKEETERLLRGIGLRDLG